MAHQINRTAPAVLSEAAARRIAGKGVNNGNVPFEPATGWLNIGIVVDGVFISIQGAGVPVERLKETTASATSNEEWQSSVAVNNHLISLIQQKLDQLQPGESTVLNLQVELRKPGEKVMPSGYDLSGITI